MSPNTTPIRQYKIYSIFDPTQKTAYLGKSYAISLAPLYSKHLCGKNPYTKNYYGKEPPHVVPTLCILERLTGSYRDAYRQLVAWTRFFLDHNYTMIMQEGTIQNATALTPATESIYNSIRLQPLDTVLQQGLITSRPPRESNKINNPDHRPKERKSMQYNLRVYEDDLKKFLRLCHDHGLTRKAGFSLLLSFCNSTEADKTSFAANEIKLLHERLAAQTAALKIAQDTVDKLSMRLRQDLRYQSLLQTTQALLKSYCEVALIDDEPFARLRICRADQFPHLSSYQYPATEQGTQTIILQGLVYGNGRTPAIFVLARTVYNQLLKYRYYPRSDYVGIQIPNSGWTYLGAKWIVSWTRTRDGAIQLTGSLPLPLSLDTLVPEDYIRYQQDKMSLDQKIKNAQNRP